MPTLLEKLAAGQEISLADTARGNTRVGRLLQREGVPDTPDLRRVLSLPQKRWEDDPETAELCSLLTKHLRAVGGTQELQPAQAVLLRGAYENEGAVGALKMGEGKSHAAFCLPTLLKSKRAVLLAPGSMVKSKAVVKHFQKIAEHFRSPENLEIVSYSVLSQNDNENLLEKLQPDLIIPDEAQALQHLNTDPDRTPGLVRRVMRYLAKYPSTRFVPLSGTMIEDKPIPNYHHLMRWALGERMPLPLAYKDALVWSRALDPSTPMAGRMALGALSVFGADEGQALAGLIERFRQTPGVVLTRTPNVSASLQIELIGAPNPCQQQIYDAYAGKDPDGNPLDEHDIYMTTTQLACGFFYEKDPKPPKPWLDSRREYKRIEAVMLASGQPGMDTDLQVEMACSRMPKPPEAYVRWRSIRDTYQPKQITRWLSYDVIDYIAKIAEPGTIIWTYFTAPGKALAHRHGLRYFGQHARDANGPIESAAGATCVASLPACSMGRNLQEWWYKNLYITPGPFEMMEQSLGRTHRQFQKEDRVFVRMLAHTPGYRRSIESMRALAESGSGSSRFRLADWV